MENIFNQLNSVNVNEHTEKKNGLTYLSWAWAWAEVKKQYPTATYEIKMFDGKPFLYDEDLGYMVMTEMSIGELAHEMWLPVMDNKNKAMKDMPYEYQVKNKNFKYAKLKEDGKYYDSYGNEQTEYITERVERATMFDINTAIMRCLVKNIAMFGLGLYIYAGEDLPQEDNTETTEKAKNSKEVNKEQDKIAKQTVSEVKVKALETRCEKEGVPVQRILDLYKVSKLEELNEVKYANINANWEKIKAVE